MAKSASNMMRGPHTAERISEDLSFAIGPTQPAGEAIADAVPSATQHSSSFRLLALLLAVAAGASSAPLLLPNFGGLTLLLCVLAFCGGLLSTWSPCGYSSLSLLRIDPPHSLASISRWIPTMFMHALGYAAGGMLLALALAGIGWLIPVQGVTPWTVWTVAVIALAALLYGLHQLNIVEMPYPQLRLQVSHGARMNLPKWATGFLYGCHLGLNFATYIRTPILYILLLACVLSGSLLTTMLIIFSLNLGRFLPLLVNLLPVPDWSVQSWLAAHDSDAITIDGSILVFVGSMLMAAVAISVV